ncbi:hypothetical protein K503DRAFT_785834 [Rhizopogon vinicolor AM-OR11-026]|uniref:Glycosyl transferase CAP10 domain-containing protein n=1 Tax=Rhizopogon vinicolor AM-OR11-026 TaxID=1314800 RepID=A0A1B7MP15_9AGAM|nr:hypothetical protein K503DRAFT_785834 [Rhizopogon vinicolor AM-OR11-026]
MAPSLDELSIVIPPPSGGMNAHAHVFDKTVVSWDEQRETPPDTGGKDKGKSEDPHDQPVAMRQAWQSEPTMTSHPKVETTSNSMSVLSEQRPNMAPTLTETALLANSRSNATETGKRPMKDCIMHIYPEVYDSSTMIYLESAPSTPQQPLQPHPTHTSRPDGLLQVNPDARHPILDLNACAEEEWNINLTHASRILPDVIHEYHWRYATVPPPGFDMVNQETRIREVEDDLPLFVVMFGPHGNPSVSMTEEMRSRTVEAGNSGDYIDIDKDRTPYTVGPSAESYPVQQFSFCSTKLHADIHVPQLGSWVSDMEVMRSEGGENGKRVRVGEVKKMKLNHGMLDIMLAGSPKQCGQVHILDVDGIGWSSQLKQLMMTSATFKSMIYSEWFTDCFAPWAHYVLIQHAYSDLYDAPVFFHGDVAGRGAHEELVAKIVREAMEWSLTFWRLVPRVYEGDERGSKCA